METVRVKPNEFSVCWAASLMFRALAHVLTRATCGYVCVCVCVCARARACDTYDSYTCTDRQTDRLTD